MPCPLMLCWMTLALLLSSVVHVTDSCSSRFSSKSEGKAKRTVASTTPVTVTIPLTTTENLTEETTTNYKKMKQDEYTHIELCDGLYKTDFCLNGGTCFTHKYLQAQIYVCDCPVPFTGSRCEEKSLEDPVNRKRGRKEHPAYHRSRRFAISGSP